MRQVKRGRNNVRVEVKQAMIDHQIEVLMDELDYESFLLHQSRHKAIITYVPTHLDNHDTNDREVG